MDKKKTLYIRVDLSLVQFCSRFCCGFILFPLFLLLFFYRTVSPKVLGFSFLSVSLNPIIIFCIFIISTTKMLTVPVVVCALMALARADSECYSQFI